MKLDASLETRTSKEGKSYECVVIKISQNSEKIVFLSPAEIELLKLSHKKDNSFWDDKDMPDLR
jgi:hypothetical protein